MDILSETVIIKSSKHGHGIFTTETIPAGHSILNITGHALSFEETLHMGDEQCYALQTGINKYVIPNMPFLYSNHSCQPNCGINGKLQLVALRKIEAGEELLWDYSTSMLERHWTMECHCGLPECRHVIKDFDLLPHKLQQSYLDRHIVLPFIIDYLRNEKAYDTSVLEGMKRA
jgi:uncharacterized protein